MAQTVADVLLARLREWDIKQVFAFPGDGINGLLAAWGRADNDPQFVQARHEEMAAFEAVGYAKFSGNVGVCAATSGPGAIHLLNGLYDAKLDHVPVVAIVGQTERSAMGGSYQQEVDLLSLFKDVCSDYVQMCTVPAAAAEPDRPRDPDRGQRIRADLHHHPLRRVRPGLRRPRARVQAGPLQRGHVGLDRDRGAVRDPAGRGHPQRRGEGRPAGRAGRARLCRGADRRSPTCSAPVRRRPCSARTFCPTSCPG